MRYYFLLYQDHILLAKHDDHYILPTEADLNNYPITMDFSFLFGSWQGQELYCAAISEEHAHPNLTLLNLREAYHHLHKEHFKLAGRARQIIDWQRDHQFCGRCGHQTAFHDQDRAKRCPHCGLISYPRISPCIMVAITRGDEILLARSPHFRPNVFSILAGFIEPGESAEECVHREVYEEVGLYIKNVRYIQSQPWPFPNSLMLGYLADYDHGEIKIDGIEIEAAKWVKREELDKFSLPMPISLSYQLIEIFRNA